MRDETNGGTYVIAAGGTGGHVFPGIALAREIRDRRPDAAVLFVGTGRGLEAKLVPDAGFALELIRASGFAGKRFTARLRALAELPAGFFQARRLLARHRARAVAGVGGYVTVPVLAAARSLGVPTLIHESNAFPGIANRLLNRFATRTAVGLADGEPAAFAARRRDRHAGAPGVLRGPRDRSAREDPPPAGLRRKPGSADPQPDHGGGRAAPRRGPPRGDPPDGRKGARARHAPATGRCRRAGR